MELPALAAGVDGCRQFVKQCGIELAARKRSVENFRVHASEARPQAARDHLLGEWSGVGPEQWKQRTQTAARELLFPIPPDVLEEQIAERDVRESFGDGGRHDDGHRSFVELVRARRRDENLVQRQTQGGSLRLQQLGADGVHRDPVCRFIDGRQQTANLHVDILPKHVDQPGAVLAAAPRNQHTFHLKTS